MKTKKYHSLLYCGQWQATETPLPNSECLITVSELWNIAMTECRFQVDYINNQILENDMSKICLTSGMPNSLNPKLWSHFPNRPIDCRLRLDKNDDETTTLIFYGKSQHIQMAEIKLDE